MRDIDAAIDPDPSQASGHEEQERLACENSQIAKHHISAFLLSRLLVFRAFTNALTEEPTTKHYRLWLLVQTHPTLASAGTQFYQREARSLSDRFQRKYKFFYVIDEAQLAAEMQTTAYWNKDRTSPPLLRQLVGAIETLCPSSKNLTLVLTGTGFSVADVTEVRGPMFTKDGVGWNLAFGSSPQHGYW